MRGQAEFAAGADPTSPECALTVERLERGQQLVRCSGDVADASASCVMDGIDDRGARSADTKLADPFAPERTAMRIGLVKKDDINRADVGIHRDMVAGQILIDEGAVARVDMVLLDQRRADPPRHATDHLGARGLRIEDAAANTPSMRRTRTSPVSRST